MQIVGLPPGTLTDKTDCSSNCYAHGGHLLCHDDVISTRRVSYIVYLTDPEVPWQAADGGALELYPVVDGTAGVRQAKQHHSSLAWCTFFRTACHAHCSGRSFMHAVVSMALGCRPLAHSLRSATLHVHAGEPAADPSVTLLPHFNTMALFTVQPGRSFHSIQEVYADDKPRLSISGWYHGATPPPGAGSASLAQLKGRSERSNGLAAAAERHNADATVQVRVNGNATQVAEADKAIDALPSGFEELPHMLRSSADNGTAAAPGAPRYFSTLALLFVSSRLQLLRIF